MTLITFLHHHDNCLIPLQLWSRNSWEIEVLFKNPLNVPNWLHRSAKRKGYLFKRGRQGGNESPLQRISPVILFGINQNTELEKIYMFVHIRIIYLKNHVWVSWLLASLIPLELWINTILLVICLNRFSKWLQINFFNRLLNLINRWDSIPQI